jgi:hypothetical protein
MTILNSFTQHLTQVAATSTLDVFLKSAQWEFQKTQFTVKERAATMTNCIGFERGQATEVFEQKIRAFWLSVERQASTCTTEATAEQTVAEKIADVVESAANLAVGVIQRAGIHAGQRIRAIKSSIRIAGKRVAAAALQILDVVNDTCRIALFERDGVIQMCTISAQEVETILHAKARSHRRDLFTADLFEV